MCFIIRSEEDKIDTKMFPTMLFLESIPSALKIEETVYDVLDYFNATSNFKFPIGDNGGTSLYEVVVSLFPNNQLSPLQSASFAATLANQILGKLNTYKLDDLKEFYWQVTPADVDTTPIEELRRIDQWDVYVQKLDEESTARDDPCGFQTLPVTVVDVSGTPTRLIKFVLTKIVSNRVPS